MSCAYETKCLHYFKKTWSKECDLGWIDIVKYLH